jgi:IS5 family transposase
VGSLLQHDQGVEKREETQDVKAKWHIAMRPGKRRVLIKDTALGQLVDECERLKARIRAKVEHPFRVIKRQFATPKCIRPKRATWGRPAICTLLDGQSPR